MLLELGRFESAIQALEESLRIHPTNPQAWCNLGTAYFEHGQGADATRCYQQAIKSKPDYALAHRYLSLCPISSGIIDDEILQIEQLLREASLSSDEQSDLHFAVAALLHSKGRYETAFAHYSTANSLTRSRFDYDIHAHIDQIDRIIQTFSYDFLQKSIRLSSSSDVPVFVIGMPRSGTTLVEQILSSHPDVFQKFTGHQPYAYDIKELAIYYRQYIRLMKHWNAVLPTPILEIQYEDLVFNPESNVRRMLAFCDLEWRDRCREPHKNERRVTTASAAQVRNPIYTTSTQKWKHYEQVLDPRIKALVDAPDAP